MPAMASGNAPELRISLATGLQVSYSFGTWALTGEVWQVRQLKEENPDVVVIPMDTAFYTKRYQLIPIMMGLERRIPLCDWAEGSVAFSLGAYFRYIHCRQRVAFRTISDMGESGWGFAGKVSAKVTMWKRVSFGVWFMAMGNPFETESEKMRGQMDVVSEQRIENSGQWPVLLKMRFPKTHWHLEGYRQCFWGMCLGYSF